MGPITKQLRIFVWSNAPIHYKISMMSCKSLDFRLSSFTSNSYILDMFSYYGIAIGLILSLSNYLMLGWGYEVDGFYLKSFEIWLACVVVFPCAGNLGYILLEYRLGHSNLLTSAWETLKWIPFLYVPRP